MEDFHELVKSRAHGEHGQKLLEVQLAGCSAALRLCSTAGPRHLAVCSRGFALPFFFLPLYPAPAPTYPSPLHTHSPSSTPAGTPWRLAGQCAAELQGGQAKPGGPRGQ